MSSTPGRVSLSSYFEDEDHFCSLYPAALQHLNTLHWSPLAVIREAARFLVQEEAVKILDIGSGIGKFCLAGAYYQPAAFFDGVEQREDLVVQAEQVRRLLPMNNARFLHGNFTQLDLRQYDHFYFYNSFFENLNELDRIDNRIAYSNQLYDYYSHYLYRQLEGMPSGTRIVTYCSWGDEIPTAYQRVETYFNSLLKCWIKK